MLEAFRSLAKRQGCTAQPAAHHLAVKLFQPDVALATGFREQFAHDLDTAEEAAMPLHEAGVVSDMVLARGECLPAVATAVIAPGQKRT
jgi:hypothetical protein